MKTQKLPLALAACAVLFAPAALAQEILENAFVTVNVSATSGDTFIGTTGGVDGDPLAGADNNKRLVFGSGNTADVIVNVDGQRTDLASVVPDSVSNDGSAITITWRVGDIAVTRSWRITTSTTGNPDLVRMATTLQNAGAAQHTVGLFVGVDTMIGDNDGAPLFTNAGIIESEVLFEGADVPSSWQAFESGDVANPGLTAQGVLSGGDATRPDRFLLGNWPNGVGQTYDYLGDGSTIASFNDTAVSMWWDDRLLSPGGAVNLVTYYGVGSGTTVAGDLALNLTAPAILTVDGSGQLTPNPFDVNLVIANNHAFTATDVSAQLTLPAGLTLVSGPQVAAAGDIAPGATALVTWQVEATPPAPGTGGAADPNDLSEGSAAALAVLALLNDPATDTARLDNDAALPSDAAANLIAHRNGLDGAFGTGDDDPYDTIAEVDGVSRVGPATLTTLANFAISAGYATAGGGNAIYTFGVDVTASNDNQVYSAVRDVEVPPLPVQGLEGLDVVIHTTDPSDFETVEMIVSVNDASTGAFVDNLDGSHFTVTEDGVPMENCTVNLISEGSSTARADIVFIFDVTGSMLDEIEDLKTNILAFATDLEGSNVDYNLGLVTFSEQVTGVFGMTQDASEFRAWVQSIVTDNGALENPLDAVVEALSLNMRANSDRVFILVTDETFNVVANDLGQASAAVVSNNVRVHAATLPELNVDYDPLVTGSGGRFFDITGTFASVLDDLRTDLVNRYQIRCDSPRPVRDNTTRTVNVEVDAGGGLGGEDSDTYFIAGGALRFDPTFSVADVGSTFTVNVVAESVSNLQNAHIVIDLDPSYLELVSATPGELLARDASTGAVPAPAMLFGVGHDPANGRLEIDIARQSNEGTDGTGVLLTLELRLTAATPDDLDANGAEDPTQADDLVFVVGQTGVYLEDAGNNQVRVTAVSNGDVDGIAPSLLGDFDEDGDIDLVDFNTLVTNWGSTTATLTGPTGGDIGPATGTAPNLVPTPDSLVNYRDLFVFTRMFNWFRFER